MQKKLQMKNNNLVHCTIKQKAVKTIKRKYINVWLNNNKVKFQLDTGSDLTIINAETWKRINRSTLITSKKNCQRSDRRWIKILGWNCFKIFFSQRKRKKLNAFVMEWSQNLFSMDWMEAFNIPINMFCNNVDGLSINSEKQKRELKANFPEILLEGLGFYLKMKYFDQKSKYHLWH